MKIPSNVPTRAAATFSPTAAGPSEMAAMVLMMPKTAERVTDKLHDVDRMFRFFPFRIQFGHHKILELVGLNLAVDHGFETVDQKLEPFMVRCEFRILVENGTAGRIHHVLFQRDET